MAQSTNTVYVLESAPMRPQCGEPVWSPDLAADSMATCFGRFETGEAIARAVSRANASDRWVRVAKYVRAGEPSEAQDEALELAHSLAYEHAESVIRSCCTRVDVASAAAGQVFFDTRTADGDVTDQVRYLQVRGLLELCEGRPWIISVRDESEATA